MYSTTSYLDSIVKMPDYQTNALSACRGALIITSGATTKIVDLSSSAQFTFLARVICAVCVDPFWRFRANDQNAFALFRQFKFGYRFAVFSLVKFPAVGGGWGGGRALVCDMGDRDSIIARLTRSVAALPSVLTAQETYHARTTPYLPVRSVPYKTLEVVFIIFLLIVSICENKVGHAGTIETVVGVVCISSQQLVWPVFMHEIATFFKRNSKYALF